MDKHRDRIRYPAVIKSAGYLIRGILKQKTESRRSPSPDLCLSPLPQYPEVPPNMEACRICS